MQGERTSEEIAAGLSRHEARVLSTICGGPDLIGVWGAWVSVAAGFLRGAGLARWEIVEASTKLVPTDLGRAVAAILRERTAPEGGADG